MNNVLRTSEFWLALGASTGGVLVQFGVIPKETWDHAWPLIAGAVAYVIGRFTSKIVKAVIPPR